MSRESKRAENRRTRTLAQKALRDRALSHSEIIALTKVADQSFANLNYIIRELSPIVDHSRNELFRLLMVGDVIKIGDDSLPSLYFENLKLLIQYNRENSTTVIEELTNPSLGEKLGAIISRLNAEGVIRDDLISLEQLSNLMDRLWIPSAEAKNAVEMLSSVDAYIKNGQLSERINELIKESPAARSILIHAVVSVENNQRLESVMDSVAKSITEDDPISANDWISLYQKVSGHEEWQSSIKGAMVKILDSEKVKDRALQHNLALLMNEKGLASEFSKEVNLQKLSDPSYISAPEKIKYKSGFERAKEFFLGGLKGFGVKKTEEGSRWKALQGNMFYERGAKSLSAKDWIEKIAVREGIYASWMRRGESTSLIDLSPLDLGLAQKLNPTRAYNPFVVISLGLSILEVGLNRVTAFPQPFRTLGLVLKGAGLVLIRPFKAVFHALGNLSSFRGSPENPVLDLIKQVQYQKNNMGEFDVEKLSIKKLTSDKFTQFMNKQFYVTGEKKLSGQSARDDEIREICSSISLEVGNLKKESATLLLDEMNNTPVIHEMNEKAAGLIAMRNVLLSLESRSPKTSEDRKMIRVLNQSMDSRLTELKRRLAMNNSERARKTQEERLQNVTYDKDLGDVKSVFGDQGPQAESLKGLGGTRRGLGDTAIGQSSRSEGTEELGSGVARPGEQSPSPESPRELSDTESSLGSPRSPRSFDEESDEEALIGAGEKASLLRSSGSVDKAGTSPLLRRSSGSLDDMATMREVANAGVVKAEYNEVRLVGFVKKLNEPDLQEDLQKWVKSLGLGAPVSEASEDGALKFPIEFQGGQKIEMSGKDMVLRGFSEEAYRDFKVILSGVLSQSPLFTISGADSASYARAVEGMGGGGKKDLQSRLSSVRLFIEQAWDRVSSALQFAINSIFTRLGLRGGEKPELSTEMPAPSNSDRVSVGPSVEQESVVNPDASVTWGDEAKASPIRSASAASTPEPRVSKKESATYVEPTVSAQEPLSSAPVPESPSVAKQIPVVPTKPSKDKIPPQPRGVGSGPAASWVRVKVIIAQEPDFKALKQTCDQVLQNKGVSIDYNGGKNAQEFKAVLSDPEGGKITVSASQSNPQVVVEELNKSSKSLQHMATLVTALPPAGEKVYEVSGGGQDRQQAFNEQYQAAVNQKTKVEPPSQRRPSRSE